MFYRAKNKIGGLVRQAPRASPQFGLGRLPGLGLLLTLGSGLRQVLILSFGWLITSCAQPKYVQEIRTSTQGQEQSKATCEIKFSASDVCVILQWEKLPVEDTGSFVFKTFRANLLDQSPVQVDMNPEVVLWMPSMGHGSTPVTVARIDLGTYRASQVYFIMPGEWEIQFQAKDGERVVDKAIAKITL